MVRKYRDRSPRRVMEMIVTAIHDNKEALSYLQLKRAVQGKEYLDYPSGALMPKDTFRMAIKKLRHINILKKNSPKETEKRKRIPIEFTNDIKGKYPFISMPDTYMLREESNKRELNASNRLSKNRPTREILGSHLERQQQFH